MHIKVFYNKLIFDQKDQYSRFDLEGRFKTAAWHGQFGLNTDLSNLLKALPDSTDDKIDRDSLLCLGLLWCAGEVQDRADILLKMVNPPQL